MKRQRAKIASAKAAPAADKAEFDLPDRRHAASGFIRRMVSAHIRQCVDIVHFQLAKRLRSRILHNIDAALISLIEPLSGERICIAVL